MSDSRVVLSQWLSDVQAANAQFFDMVPVPLTFEEARKQVAKIQTLVDNRKEAIAREQKSDNKMAQQKLGERVCSDSDTDDRV